MDTLKERAFHLLCANKKEGYSRHFKHRYYYTAPDEMHFHQWFWDSCFHIIVMTEYKVELAIKEFETLLCCQMDNGFIPHIIFWKWRLMDLYQYFKSWRKEIHPRFRFHTAEIQPPVLGIALRRIFEKTKSTELLRKYLPAVQKYYDYLRDERDPEKNNLISVITPMESGMDMAPQFDLPFGNIQHDHHITKGKISSMLSEYKKAKWDLERIYALGIFNFEDVAMNTIYALALEHLVYLWDLIDRDKAQEVRIHYQKVKDALLEHCWDEKERIFFGRYYGNDGNAARARVKTISSLFPICLDVPSEIVTSILDSLTDEKTFWLAYPIASVARDESSFGPLTNTRAIWRGTTWVNTNWFLAKGLLRHGESNIYEKLKAKTLELIMAHGFCEFYDPYSGEPGEAMRNFGWSTLAVDL